MNINRSNYQTFFLDYHEKNLAPQQVAELLLFLEENPDLKKEFESFQNISVAGNEKIVFDKKDLLKKNIISVENFNAFAIARIEGDLNTEEIKSFEKFIAANPLYKKQATLFAKTKLVAEKIIFPEKKLLKRGAKIIFIRPYYYAAAACIILLLAFYFTIRQQATGLRQQAIENTEEKNSPAIKQQPLEKQEASNQIPETGNHDVSLPNPPNPKTIFKKEEIKTIAHNRMAVPSLIPMKVSLVEWPEELLHLKSIELFPLYVLDEYYASAEPVSPTLFEKWKKDAVKNLSTANDSDWFADENFSPKKKTRLIDVFAAALNKVTGKKATLKTNYNESGEMVSYDFSVGKFNLKKDFSK